MNENEMVQQVARALCDADLGPGWKVNVPRGDYFKASLARARAAIAAMRKPTEEMLEILREQGGIAGYEAMIDAALKPPPGPAEP